MRVTRRTMECMSLGLGFGLLFLTMRWIVVWSIAAAAWLSASVAGLVPDLSANVIGTLFKSLGIFLSFGAAVALAQFAQWLTTRGLALRPSGQHCDRH